MTVLVEPQRLKVRELLPLQELCLMPKVPLGPAGAVVDHFS